MIKIPIGLLQRIVALLVDIARMKPGFEVYETAKQLTKDLTEELDRQQRLEEQV